MAAPTLAGFVSVGSTPTCLFVNFDSRANTDAAEPFLTTMNSGAPALARKSPWTTLAFRGASAALKTFALSLQVAPTAPPPPPPPPATPATWEFENGIAGSGRWTLFATATSALVETAHAAGQTSLTTTWGSTSYAIDLSAMTQTNTSVRRSLCQFSHDFITKFGSSSPSLTLLSILGFSLSRLGTSVRFDDRRGRHRFMFLRRAPRPGSLRMVSVGAASGQPSPPPLRRNWS